jgi:Bacterial Ig-like domain
MTTHRLLKPLAAVLLALTLAACGGGNAEAPPAAPGSGVAAAAPVVTITNNVAAETAKGDITFTFSFNRDVGTTFTADDVTVTGGTKGAFNRTSGTAATLVVVVPADSTGTVVVSVAAAAVTDAAGTGNAAESASKAFDTKAPPPPPPTGTVLANFDDVNPTTAGYEGAEGSAVETGPAGGGSGKSFKVLRSGGKDFALGIIETAVPVTATARTVSAQVYSPTAGIRMVMKIEGPNQATSGDTEANETVIVGWQTLTWTFAGVDPGLSFNKIVLLPNLGTVDAPPGKAYYFDNITLLGAAGGGGGGGPLVFSSGYTAGGATAQGGSWGYFSGDFSSYVDTFTGGGFADSTPPVADDAQYFFIAVITSAPTAPTGSPPTSGGFLGMYVTHPGLALTGQTSLAVNLGMDANFFQQASNKNIDVFVVGSTTYSNGSGGSCNVTLKGSITPTTDAMITYTVTLADMALVQPCSGGGFTSGVTTVAQALAQPIGAVNTQFTFPNVNTTINSGTAGAPVYATGITRGKTEFR